jgi:hypothetical protein
LAVQQKPEQYPSFSAKKEKGWIFSRGSTAVFVAQSVAFFIPLKLGSDKGLCFSAIKRELWFECTFPASTGKKLFANSFHGKLQRAVSLLLEIRMMKVCMPGNFSPVKRFFRNLF